MKSFKNFLPLFEGSQTRIGEAGKFFRLAFLCLILVFGRTFAQKVHVRSITPFGIEKTKKRAILWEMTFGEGDTIELSQLTDILKINQENLYNTRLFNEVKFEYETDSVDLWVRVLVKERWYFWPYPYANVEERTFNEWWRDKDLDRLVYGAGLEWSNFSGLNDRISFFGQLGYSRRLLLIYNRPYLFPRAQVDGEFGFWYINHKEIGYTTERGILQLDRLEGEPMRVTYRGEVAFTKRFSTRNRLTFAARFDHFRPSDSIAFFNPNYLTTTDRSEYYPSLIIRYFNDQRDYKAFPLKGYRIDAIVRQSGLPGQNPISTTSFLRAEFSWAHFLPLNKRFFFGYGLRQQLLLGKKVPFFDKHFIGFENQLRGYENFVIDGSQMTLLKADLKYALFPRKIVHAGWVPLRKFRDFPIGLYLSLYGNAAWVTDQTISNDDTFLKDKMLNGYGVGVNFLFVYDLMLRFELSRNHLGQTGFFINGVVPIQ